MPLRNRGHRGRRLAKARARNAPVRGLLLCKLSLLLHVKLVQLELLLLPPVMC